MLVFKSQRSTPHRYLTYPILGFRHPPELVPFVRGARKSSISDYSRPNRVWFSFKQYTGIIYDLRFHRPSHNAAYPIDVIQEGSRSSITRLSTPPFNRLFLRSYRCASSGEGTHDDLYVYLSHRRIILSPGTRAYCLRIAQIDTSRS